MRAVGLFALLLVGAVAVQSSVSHAQNGAAPAGGSLVISAPQLSQYGEDGAPLPAPSVIIERAPTASGWETALYGVLFLVRELSVYAERRARAKYAGETAERAVRVALARLEGGDNTADPGAGATITDL